MCSSDLYMGTTGGGVWKTEDMGITWNNISDGYLKTGSVGAVAVSESNPKTIYVGMGEHAVRNVMTSYGDGVYKSTDGGKTWRKTDKFPGIPDMTYVYHLQFSAHDPNVLYATFNNHKRGDFKPYLLKSVDKGLTWTAINNGLPERGSTYCIAEDFIDPTLLFAGTEFGVHFSKDGGNSWKALKGGLPVIAVRDIAIQKRENDLVLATASCDV